jgi:hypothetical protein
MIWSESIADGWRTGATKALALERSKVNVVAALSAQNGVGERRQRRTSLELEQNRGIGSISVYIRALLVDLRNGRQCVTDREIN